MVKLVFNSKYIWNAVFCMNTDEVQPRLAAKSIVVQSVKLNAKAPERDQLQTLTLLGRSTFLHAGIVIGMPLLVFVLYV